MPASPALPLVGLPSDTYEKEGLVFHSIGDKYLRAVAEAARCAPVMLPSLGDAGLIEATLDHLDGVVMTGATSNVHPPHYGSEPTADHEPYDHSRDAATLSLIPRVLARGMPLLCICRGYQELNVVLGGTLETEVQRLAGRLDHRAPQSDDLDIRYGPAHDIALTPGGKLEAILGTSTARVNTVASPGHRPPRRRAGGRGPRPRRRHRGGLGQGRQGLCTRRAMAPGVQGRPESRFGQAVRGLRRRRPRLWVGAPPASCAPQGPSGENLRHANRDKKPDRVASRSSPV